MRERAPDVLVRGQVLQRTDDRLIIGEVSRGLTADMDRVSRAENSARQVPSPGRSCSVTVGGGHLTARFCFFRTSRCRLRLLMRSGKQNTTH